MVSKNKKPKISKLKRSNQVITKLKKQGKLKMQRHRKRKIVNRQPQKPPAQEAASDNESLQGDDLMDMLQQDDLRYLLDNATQSKSFKRKAKSQSEENDEEKLEGEYESNIEIPVQKKKKYLLPIKTKEGFQMRESEVEDVKKSEEEINNEYDDLNNGDLENLSDTNEGSEQEEEEEITMDVANPISATQLLVARHEDVDNKKIIIGVLCSGILENPELKTNNFFTLFNLMDDKSKSGTENLLTVRKLATVSVLEVFKDILPDYQISQQDFGNVKLKKETLALNKFETALLAHYKRYLQRLEKMATILVRKKGDTRKITVSNTKLGNIAVTCLCDLLVSHPYFNYSSNIAQMLTPFLNNGDASVRQIVSDCFKTVFKNDKKGVISLMIVRRINHLVKSKSNDVHCDVLNCLLALRIKDVNLEDEKKLELKQKKQMSHKQRLLSMSKKERKRNKKLKEIEKEMLETKAEENKQTKQQNLTEITKLVFTIYFRILKRSPNSKLLGATLEGLSKFAHIMNIEYFSDLVNVIHALLEDVDLGYRERLHCVETVFTVLSGQGEVLNIDPSRFYSHLYRDLFTIGAGKNHSDLEIIIRSLVSVLIKRRKKLSQQLLLAYLKRVSTLSVQVLHNGTLACLSVLKSVMQQSKFSEILLELDEEIGSGRYDPYMMEPEYCNASTTALYELSVLQRHYHPTVRTLATYILNGMPVTGDLTLSSDLIKLSPERFFEDYDSSKMAFKPTIPPPKNVQPKARPNRHCYTHPNFEDYCKTMANKTVHGPFDFSEAVADFKH